MAESIKIGSKTLSIDARKKILPNYDNIFEDIKKVRANISDATNDKSHDNIFSILGGRGTGKSSILKTIESDIRSFKKNTLKNGMKSCERSVFKNDILLPIIMPELMESNDLIGWLIGYFNEEVKNKHTEYNQMCYSQRVSIQNRFDGNSCDENGKFENCGKEIEYKCPVIKPFDDWVDTYVKRNKEYKEIQNKEYTGDVEYKQKMIAILYSDVNLWDKFGEFIKSLVKYTKATSCDSEIQPLIFIFFDDLDLIPYNSVKLLETIIMYLSRANIIVFIAGDYDNMQERVLLKYLKKDDILQDRLYEETVFNKELDGNKAIDTRRQLAYDFLKKLLTPSYRYYLKAYTKAIEIKGFTSGECSADAENCNVDGSTLSGRLNEYILKFKNSNSKEEIPDYCYLAFDTKPRGLINIYKFLSDTLKSDCNKINKVENIRSFIDLIISCKDSYQKYSDDIRLIFEVKKSDEESVLFRVDYIHLEDICQKIIDSNDNGKKCNKAGLVIIDIYYMVYMMEFIFGKNEKSNKNERNINRWLNYYVEDVSGIEGFNFFNSKIFTEKEAFSNFNEIKDKIGIHSLKNIDTSYETLESLMQIYCNKFEQNKDYEFMKTVFVSDYRWTKALCSFAKSVKDNTSELRNTQSFLSENVDDIIAETYLTWLEKKVINNDDANKDNIDENAIFKDLYPQNLKDLFDEVDEEENNNLIAWEGYSGRDILEIYYLRVKYQSLISEVDGVETVRIEELILEETEEAKIEEAKIEEAKIEEAKIEEAKTEEAKTEEATTEEVKTEEVKTEEAKTEEATTEEVKNEEATTEEATTEEATTEEATTEEATTEEVKTEEVTTEEATTEEATTEEPTPEESIYVNSFLLREMELLKEESDVEKSENLLKIIEADLNVAFSKINMKNMDIIRNWSFESHKIIEGNLEIIDFIVAIDELEVKNIINLEALEKKWNEMDSLYERLYLNNINEKSMYDELKSLIVYKGVYSLDSDVVENKYNWAKNSLKVNGFILEMIKLFQEMYRGLNEAVSSYYFFDNTMLTKFNQNNELLEEAYSRLNLENIDLFETEKDILDMEDLRIIQLEKIERANKIESVKNIISKMNLDKIFEKIIKKDFSEAIDEDSGKESGSENNHKELLNLVIYMKELKTDYKRYININFDEKNAVENAIIRTLDNAYKKADDSDMFLVNKIKDQIEEKMDVNSNNLIEDLKYINSKYGFLEETEFFNVIINSMMLEKLSETKLKEYSDLLRNVLKTKQGLNNMDTNSEKNDKAVEETIVNSIYNNDIYKQLMQTGD